MTNEVMISGALSGCFTIVVWGSSETELTAVRVNPYKREAKNGNAPRLTLPKQQIHETVCNTTVIIKVIMHRTEHMRQN